MTCASPPPPRAPPSAGLAPGFRFHPTDEELVGYYLKRKISGRSLRVDAIAEVDLYREEPWDLPGKSRIRSRDAQWYFFCSLDRKYASRSRTNRATNSGYWKTTGKDRAVWRGGRAIGMKKTLVFHSGRAPRGERTNWVMHEYRLEDEELARAGIPVDAFVVCRVFQKKGPGPQNGAQYGAPLDEEEWEDDELPAVKEEDGEGLFVVAKLPVLADEENKDTGIQVKSFVDLIEPDKQGELSNSSNADKHGKMRKELGDDGSMDGSTGVPGPRCNQNLSPVAVNFNTTDENTSLLALDDEYVEMNDFPYIKRANCQEIVASREETPEDFVDGGIIPSRELDDMKQYLNIDDENNFSTQFLPLGTSDENCSVQLDDSQCPDPDSCSSDKPADDEFVYPDPPSHFLDAYCGFTSDINSFIDANVANTSGPAFMDELMAYFDATENIKLSDLKFENEASTSNELKPVTVVNASLEMAANCSASSSIPDVGHNSSEIVDGHGQQGTQSDNSCDKALTERLAGILNAISPPPAFAAEYPVKHRSAAVLSSRVTAGMIQIHGIAVFGSEDLFTRKNMDAGLILSRATPSNAVTGDAAFFESVMKIPGGVTTFILHNTFHLLFISVLFLAASYRIGVYVCTR